MASSTFSMHDRLVTILERYISPITVRSVLTGALAQRDPAQREIDVSNVVDVVGEVMIGLRLFCDQEKLADLMLELADFCDRETQPFHPVPSTRGVDLAKGPAPSSRGVDLAKVVPIPSSRGGSLPVPSSRGSDLPRGDHELYYASSR